MEKFIRGSFSHTRHLRFTARGLGLPHYCPAYVEFRIPEPNDTEFLRELEDSSSSCVAEVLRVVREIGGPKTNGRLLIVIHESRNNMSGFTAVFGASDKDFRVLMWRYPAGYCALDATF